MTAAYLGLDPSYTGFGIVALASEGDKPRVVRTHELTFPTKRYGSGPGRLFRIHATLRDTFGALRDDFDIRRICIEGYAPGRRFGREAVGELGGITRLALAQTLEPELIAVPSPTALKKFVTSSGTAAKDNILLGVYKKWGEEFKSNNLADAYGLARIAYALVNGATLKYEQEVLDAMAKPTEEIDS